MIRHIFLTIWLAIAFFPPFSLAQTLQVCGRILEAKTGRPLSKVSVNVQGSKLATQTDHRGKFCLGLPAGEAQITFRKLGYYPQALSASTAVNASNEIILHPVPRLVDMYGKPIANARVMIKPLYGEPILIDEVTDSRGFYAFDFTPGQIQVFFEKAGYRTDGFVCYPSAQQYYSDSVFVLCPEQFGVYMQERYIPPVEIEHRKAAQPSYGGGLNIPRVRGHWEGDYYVTGKPVAIPLDNRQPLTFYFYPQIAARLGSGNDPFRSKYSVLLLQVDNDGKFASFGPRGGEYREIEVQFEPIVQRTSLYQGGLVSREVTIYRGNITLPPGKYAFCRFKIPPLHRFPIPEEKAYYFEVIK